MIDKSTIESLRDRLPDYVNSELTKEGKEYVCPCCGKVHLNVYTEKGEWKWKCFYGSCQNQGDLFDLVGYIENIPNDASTFPQRVRIAAESLGVHISGLTDTATSTPTRARKNKQKQNLPSRQNTNKPLNINNKMGTTDADTTDGKRVPDYSAFFAMAQRHLPESKAAIAYLDARHISLHTAQRAGLGFVEQWIYPHTPANVKRIAEKTRRIIIPHDNGSYFARAIDELTGDSKRFSKQYVGDRGLFYATALTQYIKPVFIVEGEFDALSILELGELAVGLGGDATTVLLKRLQELPAIPPLILALDNDKAGQSAQEALAQEIISQGIPATFVSCNLLELCNRKKDDGTIPKDANEMLVLDKDALRRGIDAALQAVEKARMERATAYETEWQALNIFLSMGQTDTHTKPFPTGFSQLDKVLDDGLYPGLYILGAVPSLGKTTFALQIADYIASGGNDVLFFSLEMSKHEIIAKILSRMSYEAAFHDILKDNSFSYRDKKSSSPLALVENIASTTRDILRQSLMGERAADGKGKYLLASCNRYRNGNQSRHLYIREGMGNYSADTIATEAYKHLQETGHVPVIIVDYLQILQPKEAHGTDKTNTDYSVLAMKRLSRDLRTPVLVISSLNREGYGKETLDFASFKESGAVEYGSDVLMGLQINSDGQGQGKQGGDKEAAIQKAKREPVRKIELVILKNRNGALPDKIHMTFIAKYNFFAEGNS